MYYYNTDKNYENSHDNDNQHGVPLFSQSFDPTLLNGLELSEFTQEIDPNSPSLIFNDSAMDNEWDFLNSQQEAILLSDPNFLRQHQLLQDESQPRLQYTDDRTPVSNLSAMIDQNIKKENTLEDKKQKKSNHRKQHVMLNTVENEHEDKIDHQRRFSELQARFRINYAKKPPQQVKLTNTNREDAPHMDRHPPEVKKPSDPLPPPTKTTIKKPPSTSTLAEKSTTPAPVTLPLAIGGLVMNNAADSYQSSSRSMPIQIQKLSRSNSSQPFDAESHQKQLDNQLEKVDFDDITVSELKEMLRQRGKPATGKKAVLLQRLQEERELAKGGRSAGSYGSVGRMSSHRHSQPLPFSRSLAEQSPRPKSFQGSSSPVMIQQTNFGSPNSTFGSPSSPSLLSSSYIPGSPGASLHRSIANMQIGSPPANVSRRYSPYSPRQSSSPKLAYAECSSLVPLSSSPSHNHIPSNNPPVNNNNHMMLSSSYSVRNGRHYNNPKAYKPFTSSALATPDREEDVNPFDSYYAKESDPPIKEEEMTLEEAMAGNTMDWIDPNALEILLQQQGNHLTIEGFYVDRVYSLC